ncbi:hypothetical protein ACFCW2_05830 [Qipengyuania sp. DSG2-2]|uniref:hypothetical protein n=1 Tax=Qipengyuania sp. DGS2-2 TaxID=3349631 RepID=UPI0036D238C2
MRKLIVWLLALPLAALAMSAAIGGATKLRNPSVAEQMWPTPGLTFQKQAETSFASRIGDELTQIDSAYRPEDGVLARQAFAKEPSAYYALSLLALDASATGDANRARDMFAILSELDKRQTLANLWQLFDYGNREQLGPMMRSADQLFRSNVQARDRIMPGLADATAIEGAVPAIEAELADNPPWAWQYWWSLVRKPAAFDNGAELRARAHRLGLETPPGFDRAFLFALAEAGKLDAAQSLAAELGDTEPLRLTSGGTLTFDFTESGGLPPFAWDVVSEGEYGGYYDPQLGELGISAMARTGGTVAQRLIAVAPGTYLMTVQARLMNTAEAPASVTMRCANRARTQFAGVELTERNSSGRFTVPSDNCAFGWIEVQAESVDDAEGYDIAVETIRIAPAS